MLKVLTLVARRPSVWTGEYGRHQDDHPRRNFFWLSARPVRWRLFFAQQNARAAFRSPREFLTGELGIKNNCMLKLGM